MNAGDLVVAREALCLAVCAAAAIIDQTTYRIPNWLTGSAAVAGVLLHAVAGAPGEAFAGAAIAALSAVLLLAIGGALGALGVVGMGDVKLIAAVGALIGARLALDATLYAMVAGGLIALAH